MKLRKRAKEPKSTGVERDHRRSSYSYKTTDEGQTGRVTCFDSPVPNEGDYLILRNGDIGARYKAVSVRQYHNVDPGPMWTAAVRHAPSTRP